MKLLRQLDKEQGEGSISFLGIDVNDPSIKLSTEDAEQVSKTTDIKSVDNHIVGDDDKNNDFIDSPVKMSDKSKDKDDNIVEDKDNTGKKPDDSSEPIKFDDDSKLSFLNEVFKGKYDSVDQAVEDYQKLNTRVSEYEKQIQELTGKANKAINPFGKHEVLGKALNFMEETGLDLQTFLKVQNMDLDNLNHIDLLVEDFMLRNPNVKKGDVLDMFKEKYKISLDSFDEYDPDDEELKAGLEKKITRNKLNLINDASPIVEKFKGLKSKISSPDFEGDMKKMEEEEKAKIAMAKEGWSKILPEMVNSFNTFKDVGKDGKDVIVEMEVSTEQKDEIKKYLNNYLENNGYFEVNKDSVGKIGMVMYNLYKDLYKEDIYKSIREKAILGADKKWAERTGINLDQFRNDNAPIDNSIDKQKRHNEEQDKKVLQQLGLG